jgi:hypothetical protein
MQTRLGQQVVKDRVRRAVLRCGAARARSAGWGVHGDAVGYETIADLRNAMLCEMVAFVALLQQTETCNGACSLQSLPGD